MNSDIDETILKEIASKSHTSLDHVRSTYQTILGDLRAKARIHDFIPVLAMNSVRQHFRDLNLASDPTLSFSVVDICKEKAVRSQDFFEQHYAH